MMKRFTTFLLAGLAVFFLCSPLHAQEKLAGAKTNPHIQLSPKEQKFLQNHPTLRVSNEMDWPPFDFVQNGKPTGYSIEYLKLLARDLGIELEFVNNRPWIELVDMFKRRELDILHSLNKTEQRKQFTLFCEPPIAKLHMFIYARKADGHLRTLEDLEGKTVAMAKGWANTEVIRSRYPKINITLYPNVMDMLRSVAFGEADATLASQPVADYLLESAMLTNVTSTGAVTVLPESAPGIYIGVRSNLPMLKNILEKAMASTAPEDIVQLKRKWFGTNGIDNAQQSIILTADEQRFLKDHPVIRVHNEMNCPPFNFNDDGTPKGLTIDIINRLAELAGFEIEYVFGPPWSDLERMFREGRIDILGNLKKTKKRQHYALFTAPYSKLFMGIAVKHGNEAFAELENLEGNTVAVVRGSWQADVLAQHYGKIRLVEVENVEATLRAVASEMVDAAIGAIPAMDYAIQRLFLSGLTTVAFADNPHFKYSELAFGVRKDWPILRNILEKGLAELRPVALPKLKDKWLSTIRRNPQVELSNPERDYLKRKGKLFFCVDPDWMPHEGITGDAEITGITSEYIKLISKRIGIPMELLPTSTWVETLTKARNRECDFIPLATSTPDRRKYLTFTEPYTHHPLVVATRQDQFYVDTMKDLFGKKVGMVKGYAFTNRFKREYPEVDFVEVDFIQDGLRLLHRGDLDAVIDTVTTLGYKIRKEELLDLKIAGRLDEKWSLGMGARSDEPHLRAILQKGLDTISEEEKREIHNKWIGVQVDSGVTKRQAFKWGAQIGAGILLLLALILLWNWRMRREIAKRRETEQDLLESQAVTHTLFRISSTVTEAVDTYSAVESIHAALRDHLDVNNFFIALWNQDKREQHYFYFKDEFDELEGNTLTNVDFNDPPTISTQVIATGKPMLLREGDIPPGTKRIGAISKVWLGVPLRIDQEVIGVMAVQDYHSADHYSEKDVDLMVAVSDSVASVIHRKRTEEILLQTREDLRVLFYNLPIGIYQSHIDGYFLNANPVIAEMFGYESVDQFLAEINDVANQIYANPAERQVVLKSLLTHGYLEEFEVQFKRRDGTPFWVSLDSRLRYDHDGNPGTIDGHMVDITERRKMHKALVSAKINAEQAREEALEATRAKSDFLARMSHEIRTPMNAIIGMGELLSETPLSYDQQDYIQTLQSSCEILLSIINDILDFSKVEAGQIELEEVPFDLIDLMESTGRILGDRARQKGLELAYHVSSDVHRYVSGDLTRIKQILINLIGNAIKFTSKGSVSLRIAPGPDPTNPELIEFSVTDTGIGIPEDKQELIFDSFAQADTSTTREYGGTGLGLAISRRLAELMGGRMWIKSEINAGSTFFFTLRLRHVEDVPASTIMPTHDILKLFRGMRILVVDDNATNRLLMHDHLTRWGAMVDLAEDGETALERIDEASRDFQHYTLIFLDVIMPGIDGLDVAAQIKKRYPKPPPHVIINTSSDTYEDRVRAKELDLEWMLPKPVKRVDLLHLLSELLGHTDTPQVTGESMQAGFERLSGRMVLLAEDIAANRKVIHKYLKDTPLTIVDAENGQEAVDIYTNDPGLFDIIIMDKEMPIKDGVAAMSEIRVFELENKAGQTPIIALTAHAFAKDRHECFQAGCNDFISKPVKKKDLLQAILRLIDRTPKPEKGKTMSSTISGEHTSAPSEDAPIVVQVASDMEDLIPDFLDDLEEEMLNMQSALESANFDELRRLAHGYKGAAGNYGMNDLARLFLALEQSARGEDAETSRKRWDETNKYLTRMTVVYE